MPARFAPRLKLAVLVATGVSAAAIMCASPTEIVVDVYTDVPCTDRPVPGLVSGRDLADLAARVDAPSTVATSCAEEPARLGRVVLRPGSDKDAPLAFQIATRTGGAGPDGCLPKSADCIVARRQISFARGESLTLAVRLRRSCRGVVCGERETCVDGTCASAEVSAACSARACDDSDLRRVDGGAAGDGATAAGSDAGPTADSPTVVRDADGGVVSGLATDGNDLVWIETPPGAESRTEKSRIYRAPRSALASPSSPAGTSRLVAPVAGAGGATFAQALTKCAGSNITKLSATASAAGCYTILSPAFGIATDDTGLYIGYAFDADDAGAVIQRFDPNDPTAPGATVCRTDAGSYLKVSGQRAYSGHPTGWIGTTTVIGTTGAPCEVHAVPGLPGYGCRAVAATPGVGRVANQIVCCAATPEAKVVATRIACFTDSAQGSDVITSSPAIFDTAAPIEDMALVWEETAPGVRRAVLYYASPPGIWRLSVDPVP